MTDFVKLLRSARTIEDRAKILKDELSLRKSDVERFNGGLVLDIEEYEGLRIGDRVLYANALGQKAEGYLSHFFTRMHNSSGSLLAEKCKQYLVKAEGRDNENHNPAIIPIMVSVDSSGYSTHHESGLPQKSSK